MPENKPSPVNVVIGINYAETQYVLDISDENRHIASVTVPFQKQPTISYGESKGSYFLVIEYADGTPQMNQQLPYNSTLEVCVSDFKQIKIPPKEDQPDTPVEVTVYQSDVLLDARWMLGIYNRETKSHTIFTDYSSAVHSPNLPSRLQFGDKTVEVMIPVD